jgi:hypothetical protein
MAASMKLSVSPQLLDLRQSVGLLGRVISSSQGLESEDSSWLRPLGYRDRLLMYFILQNSQEFGKSNVFNLYHNPK